MSRDTTATGTETTASTAGTGHNPLVAVRETALYHWLALAGGSILGLVLASVHPLGLVVGGALVGLAAADLLRALLSGLGFGVLVVLVWVGSLWWADALGRAMAMGELTVLAIAIAIVLPVVGSLLRGVV